MVRTCCVGLYMLWCARLVGFALPLGLRTYDAARFGAQPSTTMRENRKRKMREVPLVRKRPELEIRKSGANAKLPRGRGVEHSARLRAGPFAVKARRAALRDFLGNRAVADRRGRGAHEAWPLARCVALGPERGPWPEAWPLAR